MPVLPRGQALGGSKFTLDLQHGEWLEELDTMRVEGGEDGRIEGQVEVRQLVHRRHTRSILTVVRSLVGRSTLVLEEGEESADVTLGPATPLTLGPNILGMGRMAYRCGAVES